MRAGKKVCACAAEMQHAPGAGSTGSCDLPVVKWSSGSLCSWLPSHPSSLERLVLEFCKLVCRGLNEKAYIFENLVPKFGETMEFLWCVALPEEGHQWDHFWEFRAWTFLKVAVGQGILSQQQKRKWYIVAHFFPRNFPVVLGRSSIELRRS